MDHSVDEAEHRRRLTDRARKGGHATKAKYGSEHYRRIGAMGGRPTFWESLAKAQARDAENKHSGPKPGRSRTSPPAGAKAV